jgi:predicted DNA-binding protein (MmcQ/YjbR family)
MNWDELRAACLALPGTEETFAFGPGVSVFKAANGKMYAVSVTATEPLDISLKCDPDQAVALRNTYAGITEGYHLNKRHWITATLNTDVPDPLIQTLIEESHRLVTTHPSRRRVPA